MFSLSLKGKYTEKDTYYVFNHLEIKMYYHKPGDAEWDASLGSATGGRIVSAKVIPHRYSQILSSASAIIWIDIVAELSPLYQTVMSSCQVFKSTCQILKSIHKIFLSSSHLLSCKIIE